MPGSRTGSKAGVESGNEGGHGIGFGTGIEDIAAELIDATRKRGWVIATAESCTAGMVAGAITAIAGASDVFDRGFITYSNDAKRQMLGVKQATLEQYGAVSEATALAMVAGIRTSLPAALCLSVTGIAGPGGSNHKPEGRVCFSWALPDQPAQSETVEFGALGRTKLRAAAVQYALELLLDATRQDTD